MFESTSRYAKCGISAHKVTASDGTSREVPYVRRRFIPPAENMTLVVEHTFVQGERLDNITARYLGDPTQFWRICDANEAMKPEDLEEVGRSIRIAVTTE